MHNYLKSFLAKPWSLETVVFFLVLWQESFRLSSRTSQQTLLIGSRFQDFYYYHFGDFVNGFVIAFILDGLAEMALFRKQENGIAQPRYSKFKITHNALSLCATFISILIIMIVELGWLSLATTSDIFDIPAGIAGSLLYYFVRLFAVRFRYGRLTPSTFQKN
jgi:hypothetical protein